jgi:hypothetical protein
MDSEPMTPIEAHKRLVQAIHNLKVLERGHSMIRQRMAILTVNGDENANAGHKSVSSAYIQEWDKLDRELHEAVNLWFDQFCVGGRNTPIDISDGMKPGYAAVPGYTRAI